MKIKVGDFLVNMLELSKYIEVYDIVDIQGNMFISNVYIIEDSKLEVVENYRLNMIVIDNYKFYDAKSKRHEIFRKLLKL